jgi:hypothetical protein
VKAEIDEEDVLKRRRNGLMDERQLRRKRAKED